MFKSAVVSNVRVAKELAEFEKESMEYLSLPFIDFYHVMARLRLFTQDNSVFTLHDHILESVMRHITDYRDPKNWVGGRFMGRIKYHTWRSIVRRYEDPSSAVGLKGKTVKTLMGLLKGISDRDLGTFRLIAGELIEQAWPQLKFEADNLKPIKLQEGLYIWILLVRVNNLQDTMANAFKYSNKAAWRSNARFIKEPLRKIAEQAYMTKSWYKEASFNQAIALARNEKR